MCSVIQEIRRTSQNNSYPKSVPSGILECMGWEEFEQMERQQLRERREGKLCRALGVTLPDETTEQLDRIGEHDRRRTEQGLVPLIDRDGTIFYKHIDDLFADST
jgi:hypothetical protein